MAEIIESAVALPEPEDLVEHRSDNNTLKRRQSEDSGDESSSKRRRTSSGKTSPRASNGNTEAGAEEVVVSSAARPRSITPVASRNDSSHASEATANDTRDARKKSATAKAPDEKQRSKRLFGALLGNLNRPSDRTSKRRAEIEQRKKAELQKQDDERLGDRQRRLERLAIQRKDAQVQVEEQNMRIRHENLLNTANFLQTRAEPKLYYRPWDLLPDEEDLIEKQLKEAQEQIDREVIEWEDEHPERKGIFTKNKERPTSDENEQQDQATGAPAGTDGKTQAEEMTDEESKADPGHTYEEADASTNDGKTETVAETPASPQRADAAVDGQESKQNGDTAKHEMNEEEAAEQPEPAEKPQTNPGDGTKTELNGHVKDDNDENDDDGDHVVEGDEDDVIY